MIPRRSNGRVDALTVGEIVAAIIGAAILLACLTAVAVDLIGRAS